MSSSMILHYFDYLYSCYTSICTGGLYYCGEDHQLRNKHPVTVCLSELHPEGERYRLNACQTTNPRAI